MKIKCLVPVMFLSLLVSCGTPNTANHSLDPVKELFEQLNNDYNFTLESVNEAKTSRKLEVFDRYCYYYSYQTRVRHGESGVFYIENQGVQDFELVNGEVNILFHEGLSEGKIDLVESFAHDDYGSQFAHIPMSSFLGVNYKKFVKKGDNTFTSEDKSVNRVFCYYTNNYYANWEKNNEEAYIDFSKSTTTISILENEVRVNFMPQLKNIGIDYTEDGSNLTISKIGSTRNEAIDNYRLNPNPMVKKSDYGFNQEKYAAVFGDASIPFSSKYSKYIDVLEYYEDSAINIFDIDYEDGIVDDIKSQLSNKWELDTADSEYWTTTYGFDVFAYCCDSEIEEIVEGNPITNTIEVYFLFGVSPVELEETEDGKILRPRGYFVGQLYRKLGEEAIEGGEAINQFFKNIGIEDLMPNFEKYESLSPTLRDYSNNEALQASFAAQGYYLVSYYQIDLSSVTASNVSRVAKNLRDDFSNISFYSEVTLDETDYSLTVTPDLVAFEEDGTFPISIAGGTLKDEQGTIYGYRLTAISIISNED